MGDLDELKLLKVGLPVLPCSFLHPVFQRFSRQFPYVGMIDCIVGDRTLSLPLESAGWGGGGGLNIPALESPVWSSWP